MVTARGITGDARRALVAAAEAAAARDAFDAVLELSATPMLVVDPASGEVLDANVAAWELLGSEPVDAALVLPAMFQRARSAGAAPSVPTGRQRLLVGERSVDVQVTALPLRDARGDDSTVLVRIDEVVDGDPAGGGADTRLLREVVETLVDRVGTELTLAVGHAEVALRSAGETTLPSVHASRRHAVRATQGVSAVVARGRALLGGRGPTDVPELVGWARQLLQSRLEAAGVELDLDPAGAAHLPPIDASLLRQVVLNWLLALTLDEHDGATSTATVRTVQQVDGTVVTLRHDGPADLLDDGDRALTVARELVLDGGGTWNLDGAELQVHLPIVATDEEHMGGDHLSVVLVDDDDEMAALVERQLGQGGGRFRWAGRAASVAGGVELLRDLRPDVVLLDEQLPDGRGTAHLPRLRRASPRSTFLVLSAHEPPDDGPLPDIRWMDKYRALAALSSHLEMVLLEHATPSGDG